MHSNAATTTVDRALPKAIRRSFRLRWDAVLTVILLAIGAFVMIAPFAWIMQVAFSNSPRAYQLPPQFFPSEVTVQNFANVLRDVPYLNFIRNSFFMTTAITVGQLITCPMAAYPFARLNFPGKNLLFFVLLAALMIPAQVTIVPLFIFMRQIGLYNTLWSVILPPLISPFGMTLGIITFVFWWNEYFTSLVMIHDPNLQVLPVGLTLLQGRYSAGAVGNIAAGVTMAVIPILIVFLLLQRNIIKSIASTGLKG